MRNANGRAATADPVAMIREDLAALKRDFAHMVGAGVSGVAGRSKEMIGKAAESTKEAAEEAHEKLAEAAGTRPVTTILIAVAAGALGAKLVGWAFRR